MPNQTVIVIFNIVFKTERKYLNKENKLFIHSYFNFLITLLTIQQCFFSQKQARVKQDKNNVTTFLPLMNKKFRTMQKRVRNDHTVMIKLIIPDMSRFEKTGKYGKTG